MDLGIKEGVEVTLKWIDEHFSFRYFCMFFLLSLAFLLGINPFLNLLGLPPVPPVYRVFAAAISLICGAGTILFGIEVLSGKVRIWRDRKACEREIRNHLYSLPVDQLDILRNYVDSGRNSFRFNPTNGAVCELERLGILYRASDLANQVGTFPYNVTPTATKYLKREEFQKILLSPANLGISKR